MTQGTTTPRDRFREQTRGEIKAVALRQLAEGGIGAITLTRIAKELGLSGPALYRYFANRDDLVSALIRDAYDDLATAVSTGTGAGSPRARLRRVVKAYRDWARAQPHRYLLIFGSPLPGYVAPAATVHDARSALGPFLAVFAAAEPDSAVTPVVDQMAEWIAREREVATWVVEHVEDPRTAATALAGALAAWSRLHGVVGLEVVGQFDGMGHDPATLLDSEITQLADAYQLP